MLYVTHANLPPTIHDKMPALARQLLKSDTAIREPEPGTGTAHNLCKLPHFIAAGDIGIIFFRGWGENRVRAIR